MCGIAGIFDLNGRRSIREEILKGITRTLAHRGPDGEGYYIEPGVGLGHRRLSIIDLEGGKQPLFNEDQTVCVTYNGEIYNFQEIQEELEGNSAGLRKLPGTALVSDKTGKTIYTPPQSHDEIVELMKNLERFINDDSMSDVDLLVKMALIHFQFETIHPFYDGNGRTGRIINILYLVLKGLLDIPVLYLSRYIIHNKDKYYELLQVTRETGQWEQWLLYILEGVEITSQQTIKIIKQIKVLMMDYKHRIRKELPKIYSQDLLNNIFRHPYTKIDLMKEEIGVGRQTATKYLNQLTEAGFLERHKFGKHYFYVNRYLLNLLINVPEINNNK